MKALAQIDHTLPGQQPSTPTGPLATPRGADPFVDAVLDQLIMPLAVARVIAVKPADTRPVAAVWAGELAEHDCREEEIAEIFARLRGRLEILKPGHATEALLANRIKRTRAEREERERAEAGRQARQAKIDQRAGALLCQAQGQNARHLADNGLAEFKAVIALRTAARRAAMIEFGEPEESLPTPVGVEIEQSAEGWKFTFDPQALEDWRKQFREES